MPEKSLKKVIVDYLDGRIDAVGFAPVERFSGAPDKHHPEKICKNAKTVIVLGKTVPKGLLHSPEYSLHFLHRTYHSVYPFLDMLGLEVSNMLESEGHLAVPIPSFAPLVYHNMEPWGILSLKHAASLAGVASSVGPARPVVLPEQVTWVRKTRVRPSLRMFMSTPFNSNGFARRPTRS